MEQVPPIGESPPLTELSLDVPRLQSPATVRFADFWYDVREKTGAAVPFKSDMPLRALAPFMAQLALTEHTDEGRARYVLFGTGLVRDFGTDLTGDYVDGPMTDDAKAKLAETFTEFHKKHGPEAIFGRYTIGEACTSNGRIVEFENLTFPYIEPASGSVRYMSHVIPLSTLDYGEGVVARYPDRFATMFAAEKERPVWVHQDPDAPALRHEKNVA